MSQVFLARSICQVRYISNRYGRHKKHKSASILSENISIYLLTLKIRLDFSHNEMSEVGLLFSHTNIYNYIYMSNIAENYFVNIKDMNFLLFCRK